MKMKYTESEKYSCRGNSQKGNTLRRIKCLKKNVLFREFLHESGNNMERCTEGILC